MARRGTRALVVGVTAAAVALVLVVEAGAAPSPADEADAVCRSLREAVVAEVAPRAIGRRPPPPRELERSSRAFLPQGRRARDRLVAIAGTADDPDLTALVEAYGTAVDRLAQLVAAGTAGTLHQDLPLRGAITTTNARARRAGTPACVL
jgi:hypothetical protein